MEEEESGSPDNPLRQFSAGAPGNDENGEPKKSQAQRLWEFELWTNEKTLKDLEYSQRRTDKKQRRRQRKRNRRYRRWKLLYLPALVGMLGGTMLTLTATLQGLGQDTFLWDIRHIIIVIGPTMIACGFLCLLLAAGCTFQYESQARKVRSPPEDFIGLLGFRMDEFQRRRSNVLHSVSVDTDDMPMPADLDPSQNYVVSKSRNVSGRRARLTSQSSSACSIDVLLTSQTSYSSTASWVQSLTVTPEQQRCQLIRQQSDINIVSTPQSDAHKPPVTRCRDDSTSTDCTRSHSDLHVVCTRSWASSGYHSCASDTTSVNLEARTSTSRSGCRRGLNVNPLAHAATGTVYSTGGCVHKGLNSSCSVHGRRHSTFCSVNAFGFGSPAKSLTTQIIYPATFNAGSSRRHFGSTSSDKHVMLHDVRPIVRTENISPGRTISTCRSWGHPSSARIRSPDHIRPIRYTSEELTRLLGIPPPERSSSHDSYVTRKPVTITVASHENPLPKLVLEHSPNHDGYVTRKPIACVKKLPKRDTNSCGLAPCPTERSAAVPSTLCDVRAEVHRICDTENNNDIKVALEIPQGQTLSPISSTDFVRCTQV